jgi:hypothetical protein
MGTGWEQVLKKLNPDLEVEYISNFEKKLYCQIFMHADYFLYFGFDEGSMGYLDALSVGVTPIVSNQGFHKDLYHKDIIYFDNHKELLGIFAQISSSVSERTKLVEDLSWKTYAYNHYMLWKRLLNSETSVNYKKRNPSLAGLQIHCGLFAKRAIRFLRRML